MSDKLEKAKQFYQQHKVAVWIMGLSITGIIMVHIIGSSLSEFYAVDAID